MLSQTSEDDWTSESFDVFRSSDGSVTDSLTFNLIFTASFILKLEWV